MGAVRGLLGGAFGLLPDDIVDLMKQAARSVKRWVGALVASAARWLRRMLGAYLGTAKDLIELVDPANAVGEQFAGRALRKLARITQVRKQATANLANVRNKNAAIRRVAKL